MASFLFSPVSTIISISLNPTGYICMSLVLIFFVSWWEMYSLLSHLEFFRPIICSSRAGCSIFISTYSSKPTRSDSNPGKIGNSIISLRVLQRPLPAARHGRVICP
jgi:hypothetical protein